jgi:excisionase family DNA binding protein
LTLRDLARSIDQRATEHLDYTTRLIRCEREYNGARRTTNDVRAALDVAIAAERTAELELRKAVHEAAKDGSAFRDLPLVPDDEVMARNRLLAPKEVAAMVGCSVDTVRRAIKRGDVETVLVGQRVKMTSDAVELWLAGRKDTVSVGF